MSKKIRNGNIRTGILSTKIIECTPKEFKVKLENLLADGIVIRNIETEPILYQYKINYYEERKLDTNLNDEEWRDIPGKFFGQYQVSSLGRLRSIRILKEYERSVLTDGDKNRETVNVKKLFKQVFSDKHIASK